MKLTAGYICLKKIRIYARHGVMPQERLTGGEFEVSIKAKYPIEKAIESDDLADTINYAKVLDIINTEMQKPSSLLEHVAGRIAKSIFAKIPEVESIDIILAKINPPMAGDIGSAAAELHLINDKTI